MLVVVRHHHPGRIQDQWRSERHCLFETWHQTYLNDDQQNSIRLMIAYLYGVENVLKNYSLFNHGQEYRNWKELSAEAKHLFVKFSKQQTVTDKQKAELTDILYKSAFPNAKKWALFGDWEYFDKVKTAIENFVIENHSFDDEETDEEDEDE